MYATSRDECARWYPPAPPGLADTVRVQKAVSAAIAAGDLEAAAAAGADPAVIAAHRAYAASRAARGLPPIGAAAGAKARH